MTTYMVTGASGQLGQLVVDHLSDRVAKESIVALVRSDDAAKAFAAKGIETRRADYDDIDSLRTAFDGIDRLLLISSSAVGERPRQHGNVITAASDAGVDFVAYTSILNAQDSAMALAAEHKYTEEALAQSGIKRTVLRNGWYSENLTMTLQQDIQLGQHFGAAAEGKFSTASRDDYASAAAVVLEGGYDGETLELAGDTGFTLAEYAKVITDLTGTAIDYTDMPQQAFTAALIDAGLPEGFAQVLADSDAQAAKGALFDDSKTLSRIIGRPTTSIADTVRAALNS
ncbi:SDR family oxidoreductase [Loktanella sp. S4079]|uniref:SDR family oxidoreductase n=1 Tax=Loktanella sp. S4079 TaxID=579483 RepID=UPI0005FA1E6D|nr:SDR family oxidoreductase [Loktanella sp. S4079]KJZ19781.1 quinone oxidoreductase [Loktanella sp. S4079]